MIHYIWSLFYACLIKAFSIDFDEEIPFFVKSSQSEKGMKFWNFRLFSGAAHNI